MKSASRVGHDDEIGSFDYHELSGVKEPWDQLHAIQERCPVVHSTAHGGYWIVSNYAEVVGITQDSEVFSSANGVTLPPTIGFRPSIPIELDLPQHRWFRQAVLHRFTPAVVQARLPFYMEVIGGLVASVADKGRCEAVSELLQPMVANIIADLLDAPAEDLPELTRCAAETMSKGDVRDIAPKIVEYCLGLLADRRLNPRDDIPSHVAELVVDGRSVTDDEFVRMMQTLLMAGLDTTVSAGAHMLEWLADHPERQRELAADLTLIPAAIEEFLRFITPLPALRRVTTRDAEVAGHEIPAGSSVLLLFMGANHDADEFSDPDQVNFHRSPNRHVAFGAGIHRCLGSHVARQQLCCLLEEVVCRLKNLRLDSELPVMRHEGTSRGIAQLPLVFAEANGGELKVSRKQSGPRSAAPGELGIFVE
jgi:cytochrome P450